MFPESMKFFNSSHLIVFLLLAYFCNAKKTLDPHPSVSYKVAEKLVSVPDVTHEADITTSVTHTSYGSGIGTDLYTKVYDSDLKLSVSLPPTRGSPWVEVKSFNESGDEKLTLCNGHVTVTAFSTNSSHAKWDQNCSSVNGGTRFCESQAFLATVKACSKKDWRNVNCTECVAAVSIRISQINSSVECGPGRSTYKADICATGNCDKVDGLMRRCVEEFRVSNERTSTFTKLLPLWIVLLLLGVVLLTGLIVLTCLGKKRKNCCLTGNDHLEKKAGLSPVLGLDNPTLHYSSSSLPLPPCGTVIYEEPDRKQSAELSPEDEERINNGITPYEDDQTQSNQYRFEDETKF